MTKRATASLVHLWVPASNVVFLLCFVKLLASSHRMPDHVLEEVLFVTQKALVGVCFQARCVTENIGSVYKYLRTVNLFQFLLGAFLLSYAYLSSIISAVWHVVSFLRSAPIWHLLLLNICCVPPEGWVAAVSAGKIASVRVPSSNKLWERLQWFGAVPWYNHLLYSAHKWEVIPLSKVTRSTEVHGEAFWVQTRRFSEIQN